MVVRASASTIYQSSPPRMGMILEEGAWTDDDKYKLGGYFASPLDNGTWVTTGSTNMGCKKATVSGELIIGKLVSEPQGLHSTNGRQGTIDLLGAKVLEVEMLTTSDTVAIGGSVAFSTNGGQFGEGVWTKDATANGTIALAAYTTGSAAGTTIPVLFEYVAF